MHLSVKHSQAIDEAEAPVNPDQTPADMLMLSFTDSDLACMAGAYQHTDKKLPSLRLKSLAALKHPLSVDLYLDQVAAHAKVIVVRLLGGYEWWRYGVEELGRMACKHSIALAMVSGDGRSDKRLTELSTVVPEIVASIEACLHHGGISNAVQVLQTMASMVLGKPHASVAAPVASAMLYRNASPGTPQFGTATIVFYRAHYLAADTAPIDALLETLAAHGLATRAVMVTSLKDREALAYLREDLRQHPADIILDATAFAAGVQDDAYPLSDMGVPVLQCALANSSVDSWRESPRGLSTTDLAMHVVLPESDGRLFTRAISFKNETAFDPDLQFRRNCHQPEADRIAYVAELAAAWVRLAKTPAGGRRVALILSDYPGRSGRNAFAVGLDGPQSAVHILKLLKKNGYALSAIPSSAGLLAFPHRVTLSLSDYKCRFAALPEQHQQLLIETWGLPEQDAFFSGGAFHIPCFLLGNAIVALQPDRGSHLDRKIGYHDAAMPPRHGYLAFYWWLRDKTGIHAMIHLGTHGNLEWLPGKAVALDSACWPEIVLGPVPVIYPYIVSDPGEAAQAKRRISAVTLSHLTPPLTQVSLSPALAELEALVDEFSSADGLDARRMKLLRDEILYRAKNAGLAGDMAQDDDTALMSALETHLCDIKEQRVGQGLHIFGQDQSSESVAAMSSILHEAAQGKIDRSGIANALHSSAQNEATALLSALDVKFIMPGPGGSPVRGRLDILPTGRNIVTVDPRMIPTPTASLIGKRAAEEFIRRYVQDNGDWPSHVVMDVWGSATLRNGGDEIAQALHLMGVSLDWDSTSHRVSGFTILPACDLAWPRVDVSLRISGLFRDMFANLIILFDDAVQAVAKLDENSDVNPLAASIKSMEPKKFREATWRIFGNAPGAYGSGTTQRIDNGSWSHRDELARAYLDASHFVYGRDHAGHANPSALNERVAKADALIHVQDQRETDVLSGADFADSEGGFSAAASLLGSSPSLYHIDTSQPAIIKVRSLAEEISLTLQARALGAEWMEGQMRHGYAGAAAMADVVDQLFAFAATTNTISHAQFDAVFNHYLYDETVRDFIARENPAAMQAMANRLAEAIERGLWKPLRNSTQTLLDSLRGLNGEMAA